MVLINQWRFTVRRNCLKALVPILFGTRDQFSRRQVRWSGITIAKNFPQFVVINEPNVFLEFPCFFYDLADVCNLIPGSSAFSKSSLYIWKFSVHTLLKPRLKDFEHYLASMWNEHNCMVVWTFSGIAFLWDWNENRPFPVLWPLLTFPNLLAY